MNDTPIHIAYADDHKAVRKGIVSILNLLGGVIVDFEADNGQVLIAQLEAAKRLPSICMLDINMPVLNGFDTLTEIRKRWPEMKVLAFTIFDSEQYIIRMIRNGANGYLVKDCEPQELKNALLSIEQRGFYYSDTASSHLHSAIRQNARTLPNLTEKETVFLKHSCSDLSYGEIAVKMKTTRRSVEGYRDNLFKKLKVGSRVSLALYAVQSGLAPLEIASMC